VIISLTTVCAPKPTAKPTTPALAIIPSTLKKILVSHQDTEK